MTAIGRIPLAKSAGRPRKPASHAFRHGPVSRERPGFRSAGRLRQRYPPEWLIPLAPVALSVVPERAGGGWDGRAATIVARVRGQVPRRRGLRPLADGEAVAGRVPLPGLRARQ